MPKYVVAGATGRVGSVVARELLARGETPTLIVRDEARGADWSRRGADVAIGSLDDSAFVQRTLRHAAGMFTLLPENVAPEQFHSARRQMADAVVSAVSESGVPHVVMLSAITAVLPDGNGPGKDLHYFEHQLRKIVDLFGPTCSVRQLADMLTAALGTAVNVATIPPERHVAALAEAGVPRPIAEAVAEMFAALNAGMIRPAGDRRLSGATTIDATIAKCVQGYRGARPSA